MAQASFHGTDLTGFREVRRHRLPVRLESMTQLASGEVRAVAAVISGSAGSVYYARVRAAAKLGRIVRKAEERFESAQSGPVSLADLCAAAGVSQRTLHSAFMAMCGDSPIAHLKKRRLTDARLALLGPMPNRRLVKSAALESGLTHLGRFSAEYRELFGESPTTTLNRCSS